MTTKSFAEIPYTMGMVQDRAATAIMDWLVKELTWNRRPKRSQLYGAAARIAGPYAGFVTHTPKFRAALWLAA